MEESREVNAMSEQKIEQFWRDATPDDVARVMRGERIEARFRCKPSESWWEGSLAGWTSTDPKWYCKCGGMRFWNECQVYDPPEILKNKPDPGKGYRLLEKFPPEELQEGDEAWENHRGNEWSKSDYAERGCRTQCEKLWYRRRIANNPASSDSSRSSDTIPSGWRVLGKDEDRLASDAYWSQGCKEWLLIGDDRVKYANELDKWHAIRQVGCLDLVEGFSYTLPSGKVVFVTEKGFEVE
jgi:uncharacterized protein YbdZ (MbtH family)